MIDMIKKSLAALPWFVAVVALGFAGIFSQQAHNARLELEQAQHAHTRAVQEGERTAFARSEQLWRNKDEALEKANIRAIANRDSARAARSELDGLRSDIEAARATTSSGGDSCTAAVDRADTVSELLAASAELLVEVASKADGHAADALACHGAWPR